MAGGADLLALSDLLQGSEHCSGPPKQKCMSTSKLLVTFCHSAPQEDPLPYMFCSNERIRGVIFGLSGEPPLSSSPQVHILENRLLGTSFMGTSTRTQGETTKLPQTLRALHIVVEILFRCSTDIITRLNSVGQEASLEHKPYLDG